MVRGGAKVAFPDTEPSERLCTGSWEINLGVVLSGPCTAPEGVESSSQDALLSAMRTVSCLSAMTCGFLTMFC